MIYKNKKDYTQAIDSLNKSLSEGACRSKCGKAAEAESEKTVRHAQSR